MGVIEARASKIKTVLSYLQKDNMTAAVSAICMWSEPSITMDFLNWTFAKNRQIQKLSIENVAKLLPQIQILTNGKYETHIMTALECATNLLREF